MRPCPICKTETGERPRLRYSDYRCADCYRAYNRERGRRDYLLKGRPQKSTEAHKAEYQKRVSDPVTRQKVMARARLRRAIQLGKITKQPCEVCGDTQTHGHHDDYAQPLSVRWLCHIHHCEVHGFVPRAKRLSGER